MKYVSTRGQAPVLEFGDVLLAGLATDGGLYVPDEWPTQPSLRFDSTYVDTAVEVMAPYVSPSIDRATFAAMVAEAYATFDHPEVCPVRPLDDGLWLLELFWGPTIAFKDVALQLVGRLFDHELTARGERATIVVATSGDTGSAAIEACRGRANLDIVVLHPAGRVSDVQRKQMTTVDEPNVHNVAVDGTFDDCQDLVKAMFADATFRDAVGLSAMNSINWARVMAQVVYYVTAARTVGAGEPVAFSVPTGNFGNVFAGWVARRTGTPISQLVVGSNSNDILTRWLASGVMEQTGVHPTISPSMDIQVSSNAERLLFELYERNALLLADRMAEFREAVSLSAMNSINWARVMAQVVYYVTAARAVGAGDPVAYSVPTGNFGNVFAGWVARRTGTPISQLVVGSNSNDILTRWLASGVMEQTGVHPTISPSMDIQVSSNAERLLFELYERNALLLADRMAEFRDEGRVETGDTRLASVTEVFDGAAFDDDATRAEIRRTYESTGVVLDPHSAVGVAAARAVRRDPDVPMVALATAHPAKFPDAVEQAIGVRPDLPEHLADLFERTERFDELPADLATLQAHVRAVTGR